MKVPVGIVRAVLPGFPTMQDPYGFSPQVVSYSFPRLRYSLRYSQGGQRGRRYLPIEAMLAERDMRDSTSLFCLSWILEFIIQCITKNCRVTWVYALNFGSASWPRMSFYRDTDHHLLLHFAARCCHKRGLYAVVRWLSGCLSVTFVCRSG